MAWARVRVLISVFMGDARVWRRDTICGHALCVSSASPLLNSTGARRRRSVREFGEVSAGFFPEAVAHATRERPFRKLTIPTMKRTRAQRAQMSEEDKKAEIVETEHLGSRLSDGALRHVTCPSTVPRDIALTPDEVTSTQYRRPSVIDRGVVSVTVLPTAF